MFPIAATISKNDNVDIYLLSYAIMLGASSVFMSSFGYQVGRQPGGRGAWGPGRLADKTYVGPAWALLVLAWIVLVEFWEALRALVCTGLRHGAWAHVSPGRRSIYTAKLLFDDSSGWFGKS